MGLREDLCQCDVSHLPLRKPLVLPPDASIGRTVDAMRTAQVGCALICRADALAGIFTERDLIQRVLVRRVDVQTRVEDVMTPNPVTIRQSDPIAKAIRIMFQGHFRHLPVVDERGSPIGIASVKHIVAYLVDYYPSTVYNLPPQPRQVQQAREGA